MAPKPGVELPARQTAPGICMRVEHGAHVVHHQAGDGRAGLQQHQRDDRNAQLEVVQVVVEGPVAGKGNDGSSQHQQQPCDLDADVDHEPFVEGVLHHSQTQQQHGLQLSGAQDGRREASGQQWS